MPELLLANAFCFTGNHSHLCSRRCAPRDSPLARRRPPRTELASGSASAILSRPRSTQARPAAYLFSWGVGLFAWQRLMAAVGLTRADDEATAVALQVAGVALVRLLPQQSRLGWMPFASLFSPTFRGLVRSGVGGVLSILPL